MHTKPKIEIDRNPPFAPAYYEGRWVGIPLFFKPVYLPYEGFVNLEGASFEPIKRRNSHEGWRLIMSSIQELIIPWLLPIKELKEICRKNDIPLEWVMGVFSLVNSVFDRQRRENRCSSPLSQSHYREFIKCLEKINKQSALIAKTIWFFNRKLKRGGDFVTLEDVLKLKVEELSPEQDSQPHWIELQRCGVNGIPMVHWLRQDLWEQLSRQIPPEAVYVFHNKKGGPLRPTHINRHFSRAGMLVGLQHPVTSLSLRPAFNKKDIVPWEGTTNKKHSHKKHLQDVTTEEWEVICQRIPSVANRRGRKSIHCSRFILNGILHHLRTCCPFSELPSQFPWQAVESQYRRWQEKGVLKAILSLRKEISHKK